MTTSAEELREEVRRRYAEAARTVTEGGGEACCGGEKAVAAQKGKNKFTARERIAYLFDEGSFQETGCWSVPAARTSGSRRGIPRATAW